jgi:predicted transcriptional regulator
MTFPPLEDIGRRRRKIGINQRELARLSGVSQSFIAKIETGRINPSYELAKAIFNILESLEFKEESHAVDVMHLEVKGVDSSATASEASQLMSETGYSQLPVFSDGKVVGGIMESTIINSLLKVKNPHNLSELMVKEIMEEAFPMVDASTPVSIISMLLRYKPAVLVTVKGDIKGIITKADLLKIVRE